MAKTINEIIYVDNTIGIILDKFDNTLIKCFWKDSINFLYKYDGYWGVVQRVMKDELDKKYQVSFYWYNPNIYPHSITIHTTKDKIDFICPPK